MKPSPDDVYGTPLANLFQKYCEEIFKESKARTIQVRAEFTFKAGKGDLKMKTFTSPDSLTERMLDKNLPQRRGTMLQHEVSLKLRSAMNALTKKLGGK